MPSLLKKYSSHANFALVTHIPGMPRVAFAPETGAGGGGDDGVAAAEAAAAAAEKAKTDQETADKAALAAAELDKASAEDLRRLVAELSREKENLLGEVMKKKTKLSDNERTLKEYGDISPAKARELLEIERKAEASRIDAERAAAEKAGDFERVKEMMADQHRLEVEALNARLNGTQTRESELVTTINELTVGNSFSGSIFIRDNLTLSSAKTRVLYGDHFDTEGGKVTAYDKPRGAANRTALVDSHGNPLDFEASIERIILGDPDKDSILKSKMRKGAGSRHQNLDTDEIKKSGDDELYGASRISATIGNLTKFKDK